MSGAQKVSISLLISVLVFSVLAVLVAVDRFRVLETAFFIPRVEESIIERAEQAADVSDAFHERNLSRYRQFVLEDAIRAAFRINASAAQIQERRERLDALEADQASLDRIRVIDLDASQLHYSSDPNDYIVGSTQRTYLRPDEVSEDDGIPLAELAFFEDIGDDFELPADADIPASRIFLNADANQFIYRLPVLDTSGILQGAALFYVNVLDFSTLLIRNGLIGTGDQVRVINEDGIAVRVPVQVADSLVAIVRDQWSMISASEARVSLVATDRNESDAVDASEGSTGLEYEAFSVAPALNGTLVYLEPSSSLEMPLPLQYTLVGAVFLTTFLIAFLILNVRQDAIVVLRDRVKRLQVNLLREYMEAKEEIDFERWRTELEDRREDVSKQVRRGLGRLKAEENAEVDDLINRTWDEVIDVLSTRAQAKPGASADLGRIEEIVEQLTRRLASTPLRVNATPASSADGPAASNEPHRTPIEVEVLEDGDELDEVEAVEELEDGDELDEVEAVEELEDGDELDEVEAVEELEDADELDEAEALEEPDDADELQEIEPAQELEEVGEDPEAVEAVEQLENATDDGVDREPDPSEPNLTEEAPSRQAEPPRFPVGFEPSSVSFETLNEQAELEWLAANEGDDGLGNVEAGRGGNGGSASAEAGQSSDLKLVRDENEATEDEPVGELEEESIEELAEEIPDEVASALGGESTESDSETQEYLDPEVADLEPADDEELEPLELIDESESLEEMEAADESDGEDLEELFSEESDDDPLVPDELPATRHASTTFGAGLFGFGPGTEVRLPRAVEGAKRGSGLVNNDLAETKAVAQEAVQEASELADLEPVASEQANKRGRTDSGLVRIAHDRAIATADYEISELSDVLGRLHISKSILSEMDGILQIDRSAYQAPVSAKDKDVHSLVRDVTGVGDSDHAPGIEELFGGADEDELSDFASAGASSDNHEERIGISVFRFTDQGFDYDGFLRGYKRNDSGLLKSMVAFTRYWNARVGIIFQSRENEHEPYAAIGIDDRCRSSMVISKSSSVARNTLNQGRVLFIKRPLTEVEYFKDLCSPQSLAFFERSLFLPVVLGGNRAYFLLGLRGGVDSLDEAFRSILPVLKAAMAPVGSKV